MTMSKALNDEPKYHISMMRANGDTWKRHGDALMGLLFLSMNEMAAARQAEATRGGGQCYISGELRKNGVVTDKLHNEHWVKA